MPHFDPYTIPGYAEAVAKERESRDVPFLDIRETLLGVPVKPFSPIALLRLDLAGSPFVIGLSNIASHIDVAAFVWCVSARYQLPTESGAAFNRWRTVRKLRKVQLGSARDSIHEFVESAMQDSPGRRGDGGQSCASWISGIVHRLASQYGWTREYIVALPFLEIWQYLYHIRRDEDPKAVGFNQSDALINAHFREINRKVFESKRN